MDKVSDRIILIESNFVYFSSSTATIGTLFKI